MTFPSFQLPYLPPNTIVPPPNNEDLFIPYLNRLYEEIALVVNSKDWRFFTFPIGSIPTNIPNIGNSGAYIICVAGIMDGMPALTYSLIKTNSTVAGVTQLIQTEQGTTIGTNTDWNGIKLLVTSTASNFQIAHDGASTLIGNFNMKFIGTM